MFSNDRILTLDVGASKIVLGEFSCKGPSPVLTAYAVAERDPLEAGSASGDSFLVLADAVREMMAARGIKPAPLHVCLPGQTVFPRFMKIPAATADMVDSMIRDEAAENLPFPLDQVVWDYWKLGADPATGELDALIVATKSDTAQDVAALAEATGLPLAQVDAAPIALYNAVRFNYPETEGCTLALDIGARATNLVFAEGDKVFMRTIPIAGNTITNEIARGLGVEPAEAERIKKEIGFVSPRSSATSRRASTPRSTAPSTSTARSRAAPPRTACSSPAAPRCCATWTPSSPRSSAWRRSCSTPSPASPSRRAWRRTRWASS